MALRDEITGDDETSIGRDPTFLPDSEHFDVADDGTYRRTLVKSACRI